MPGESCNRRHSLALLLSNKSTESSAQHKATNSCTGQSQPLRITAERRDPRLASEGQRKTWVLADTPEQPSCCRTEEVLPPTALFSASCFTWAKSEITFCSGKVRTLMIVSAQICSACLRREGPRAGPRWLCLLVLGSDGGSTWP